MFQNIVIAGVGLIGGSLAKALRSASYPARLHGLTRTPEDADVILRQQWLDSAVTQPAELPDAIDLLVLATPLKHFPELVRAIAPKLTHHAVISDVGSVKQWVMESLSPLVPEGGQLVPGHPIAGKAESGLHAADATLFQGRRMLLTPRPNAREYGVKSLQTLWAATGAEVELMQPAVHDQIYAAVSHLPQLLCHAVMGVLRQHFSPESIRPYYLGSPILHRCFRLGGSSPGVWEDIYRYNLPALRTACAHWREFSPPPLGAALDPHALPQALARRISISLQASILQQNPLLNLLHYAGTGYADMTAAASEAPGPAALPQSLEDALQAEVNSLLQRAAEPAGSNALAEHLHALQAWHAAMSES